LKITFILPAIGKKPGEPYIRTWQVMEPLTIATLGGMTPDDVETEFFDDRIELIDYDVETDMVAMTCETYTALRAYDIAARFRERGIPVVLGGYHPTSLPGEAANYADALIIGNAESVWNEVLADCRAGLLKPEYRGEPGFHGAIADRSIYGSKRYSPLALVETGRGCTFHCEFCSIMTCYSSKYYCRDTKEVAREIEESGRKLVFFIDDNIVARPDYTKALCREIAPLGIKWSSQGSLTMGADTDLLRLMKKSGCDIQLIGLESLQEKNLEQMGKGWNARLGGQGEMVRRIHKSGISIYGTFLFGFDHDTPDSFEEAVRFSREHAFFFAAFNHLVPFPGTPLYDRLVREGRMVRKTWWLDRDYRYGDLPFSPENMSAEDVRSACVEARRRFHTLPSILSRWARLLLRNPNPVLSYIFLSQNLALQKEVLRKLELPVGSGLDELPK
jgi:radical SAM superfamily enzyme YgiQ (UPF0313 family)